MNSLCVCIDHHVATWGAGSLQLGRGGWPDGLVV